MHQVLTAKPEADTVSQLTNGKPLFEVRSDLVDVQLNRQPQSYEFSKTSGSPEDEMINSDDAHSSARGIRKLIALWAEIAVSHAVVREINEPSGGMFASVVGLDGAWGSGHSPEEALDELKSVLIDWANMKLDDGDDDIPSMEGVHLSA